MWLKAAKLQDFYCSSIGKVAQRIIGAKLRILLPDVKGQRILGLGFANPYLEVFGDDAGQILEAVPYCSGITYWPPEGSTMTISASELELPFLDLSLDIVVIIHALEYTADTRLMLREVWRVLSDRGRLVVVVPNRHGLWSRVNKTPFGYGRPFSKAQILQVLDESLFTPIRTCHSLFVPPFESRLFLSSSNAIEVVGQYLAFGVSGVIISYATKQIYSATLLPEMTSKRKYATIVE